MSPWQQQIALVCVIVATVAGVGVASGEAQVVRLDDAPEENSNIEAVRKAQTNPRDDRFYGQIEEKMQQAYDEKNAVAQFDPSDPDKATTAGVATLWDTQMKKATQDAKRSDDEVERAARVATVSASAAVETIGTTPSKDYGSKQEAKLQAVSSELKRAEKDQSKLKSEKAYVEKLDKGIAAAEEKAKSNPEQVKATKQSKSAEKAESAEKADAAENAEHTQTPWSDLLKLSQKLKGPVEETSKTVTAIVKRGKAKAMKADEQIKERVLLNPCGQDKACLEQTKDSHKDRLSVDKQYNFDNDATAPIDESPSFANVMKEDQRDEKMEQDMKDEEEQYKKLKKTGKLEPLPKHKPKPTSRLEIAKQWDYENKQHSKEEAQLSKQAAEYNARFLSGQRTVFSHDASVNFTSSPAAVALYQKLKKEHENKEAGKSGGVAEALAQLKQVKYDENKEHVKMLLDAKREAPTNNSVAELVREGALGALQLQRELALQAKIDAQNANSTGPPTTVEEVVKKSNLLQTQKWQSETMLKESEGAIVKAAKELELTGSKADLAVLDADVKRSKAEKPPLSRAEANITKTNVQETRMLKEDLGDGKIYKAFKKGLNASEAKMTKHLKAVTAEATSVGAIGIDLDSEYSGNADELLPTSYNDPMLRPDIDYGHAFDVHSYEPDEVDDNAELHPLDMPFAGEDDEHVMKEADAEIESTLGVDKLEQDFNPEEMEQWESDKVQQTQDEDDADSNGGQDNSDEEETEKDGGDSESLKQMAKSPVQL